MQKVKELAKALNILPKLRLGEKLPGGGVKPTGPHTVKFLSEPTVVMAKNHEGKPEKQLRFVVEEGGKQYRWNVPILNKEQQPHYLVEQLMDIEVGDERTLEMRKQGARNYIEIRKPGEEPRAELPDHEEDEESEVEEEEDAEAEE